MLQMLLLPLHEGTGSFCLVWVELQSLNVSKSRAVGIWSWWTLVSGAPEAASAVHQLIYVLFLQSLQLFEKCRANLNRRQQEGLACCMPFDRIGFFSFISILGIGIKQVQIFGRKYQSDCKNRILLAIFFFFFKQDWSI